MRTKPDPFELETLRKELIEKSNNTSSNNLKVFLYYNYFEKILSTNNPNFIEAFLTEFIDDYVHSITKFEVFGTNPNLTEKIITQLKNLSLLSITTEKLTSLNSEIVRIESHLDKLNSILNGKDFEDGLEHKAFFPLIDSENPAEELWKGFYGIIDSVTIRINKSTNDNKIIIVPSEKEIEDRISRQCKDSWIVAFELAKKYIKKLYQYHELIISFDKRIGFYEGNSLGIALTLSFLEQLLKFYNPTYIINIKELSAFTGGVDSEGKILIIGEDIIKQKVATIFFSEINSFVIPKYEETYAYFALTQLQKDYPNRKLKLISVEEINDVINRRDLIDIKKQKLVVRTGKFVKKNWISAAATVFLAILFAFLFLMDFDDNPALLESDGTTLFVKNKNGKLLWTKAVNIPKYELITNLNQSKTVKTIDINSDGKNEVIISSTFDEEENTIGSITKLYCYDKSKKLVWTHTFSDSAEAKREVLKPFYSIYILDTLTIDNRKSLFLISKNSQTFSSAIYRIDLETGKRLPGSLWTSGHISDALLKDINNDGKIDILTVGLDNGFEEQVVFGYTPETVTKVRLSTDDYTIQNFPVENPIIYLRIMKSDYTIYHNFRFTGVVQGSLSDYPNEKKYRFILLLHKDPDKGQMWVKLDYNLKDIDIIIDSEFRILRDSLVAQGKLNPPYTDTEAYKEIIKSNILYWKDGKWVKRNDLD